MIIKNGKVLAINSVKHDDTLEGTGLSGDKLRLSQTVREVIENKQNKLTPADNTIAISNDKIKVNTSGISAQQIHPSVFDPYASKNWVNEQGFLKQVNLEPYALSADVRREFDASAAWVNERFDNIPGAEAYYGGNGIKVIGHQINLTADVVSHNELKDASAAAVNSATTWVTNQHYLKEADLSNYATKEYAREASATAVSTTQNWVNGQGYLKSDALDPYAKTSDVNAQFNATSAWANNKFQVKGNYLTSASLDNYYKKNEVYNKTEIDAILADFGGFRVVEGNAQEHYAPRVDSDGKLSDGSEPNEKTIYLTKVSTLLEDNYKEWIWRGETSFECIGTATIDLSGYVTDQELAAELLKYYTKDQVNEMFQLTSAWATETFQPIGNYVSASKLTEYYTKAEVDEEFIETSSWATDTFQKKGNYVSATDLDNYYTKSEINTEFTETSSWATDTFQPIGEYVSATKLDEYYTKTQTDTEITKQIDDLSATVSSEYAKKTDIHEYTAGPNIEINDYVVSGRDWTDEISTKQDKLTNEQLSAISSVSSIQAVSGDWVTSASDIISAAGLAYFLVKDGDSSKWQGVNLATLGGSYNVVSEDEALLHVATARDEDKTTFTLSAKDWANEIAAKVDQDEFDETINYLSASIDNVSGAVNTVSAAVDTVSGAIDGLSATIDSMSATVEDNYVKKGEIPEPVFYDISAKYAMAQSGTYNDKDYYFISGAEIIGNNGVSAEYNANTNSWDVGLSANDLEYMYDTYRSNNTVISAGTIIPFAGTNYHNIVVDSNGMITLPETTNKFTFCINEVIEDNNPGTHAYLLNKLILSADNNTQIVSTQSFYPTEVGTSNATIAITVDHTVDPTRKYCVVYGGSEIPASAHLNVTASIVEEVVSMSDNGTIMNDYTANDPINVNNDDRKIGLNYDSQIFTLNSNNELTLTNGSGEEPIDPEVFDKLVNSINGRIVEAIPIGLINNTQQLGINETWAYLTRPMIEFEMNPHTTARIMISNATANASTLQVAIYELNESDYTLKLMWWSEDYVIPPADPSNPSGEAKKGSHTLHRHANCVTTNTIHPEKLYYVMLLNYNQQTSILGFKNELTSDIGSYDIAYHNTNKAQGTDPRGLDGALVDALGQTGGASNKPYVAFRNE